MSGIFLKIYQQAEKTFSVINKEHFKTNLQLLKKLVDGLELKDLGINPHYVSQRAFSNGPSYAPCKFVNISEKENYMMAVFILDHNFTMPLHNHPNMHGLLKVVSGRLRVNSYSPISNNRQDGDLLVTADELRVLESHSETSILFPEVSNYHELTALNGPAAFFDILSPPYSDTNDRHCSFYKKLVVDNSSERKIIRLEQIEVPNHYYCDTVFYDQPDFLR